MDQLAIDPKLRMREPLGSGGTARVVKADYAKLSQVVAVKQWRSDSADTSQSDFLELIHREYDLIGSYRFPGLVRIVEPPDSKFRQLILEYCPGPTLDKIDLATNTLTALNILSALALDLEFLRISGLVHGDLKPQNVFLPETWSEFHRGHLAFAKLSDFSLGCRVGTAAEDRIGLGTIGYLAPETIVDGQVSHRTDLFALGVIAYQSLSGVHPFLGEDSDPVKVNSRVREQEPISLAELRPDLPPEVIEVVTRLLSKKPAARPESGWATCVELEQAGATYPFRQAWRPAYLFQNAQTYDAYVDDYLTLQNQESARLRHLTGGDPATLRLLLTANFLHDRLTYDGDRFRFNEAIYWPHRLRVRLLEQFSTQSFRQRRASVIAAGTGGCEAAVSLGLTSAHDLSSTTDALAALLQPLLKVDTVKRLTARCAPEADRLGRYELATRLHLQNGNFGEAERCAELAVAEYSRTDKNDAALTLLHSLDLRARTANQEFGCRRALVSKGNIHKEMGELDQAELIYNRLISLYQTQQIDKLLAETFKNLGELFRLRQDSQAALTALHRSLDVFRDLDDELEISHTLVNIGNVHGMVNDMRSALLNYRAAYNIQKGLDAKADVASTLHNLASVYCLDGRIKRGIFLLKHTLKLKKEIGHQGEIARTLNNLGYAHQITGRPARAAEYITDSLEINRRIGSKKEVLHNLENLVALQISAGQLKPSLRLLEEGHYLATEHSLTAHQAQLHIHTATIAKRMGRYRDSFQSLDRIDALLPDLDDPTLEFAAAVQKASLRYHLGDEASALEQAREVLSRARTAGNAVAELEALFLAVRLTGEQQYWKAAAAIVDERHLVREKRLLAFGRLEFLLDHDDDDDNETALKLADGLTEQLAEVEQDLELAWMESLAGRICWKQGEVEGADRHLSRALKAASDSGLTPELITVQVLRGKLAKSQGDFEVAYSCLKHALEAGRSVADSIGDAEDRLLYQRKPIMQTLASEIVTLRGQLAGKQKAGR